METRPVVRQAVITDAHRIATIRIASWRAAYSHILPKAYLDELDLGAAEESIRNRLEGGATMAVAELSDHVVGFASWGESIIPEAPGRLQIYSLYIHPDYVSTGCGRALVKFVAADAFEAGQSSLIVGVFEQNIQARRFYDRLGAKFLAATSYAVDGIPYPTLCLEWTNLVDLKDLL